MKRSEIYYIDFSWMLDEFVCDVCGGRHEECNCTVEDVNEITRLDNGN